MCGICGQWDKSERLEEPTFNRMRDTMAHRGPDNAGSEFFEDHHLALGHRRLSIIDTSEKGHQPMVFSDLWITFNGEIYNYISLRDELNNLGHQFSTGSDTEVLLHAYKEWGIDMLNRLKGMFAFAIWDNEKKQLFLARDRFGIKPLFYYQDDQQFIFASELKAILASDKINKQIDFEAMSDFFIYRFIPSPKSIWKNVSKLPPAHYLIIGAEGKTVMKKYWSLQAGQEILPLAEIKEQVNERMNTAVKEHLTSDVPVGLLLSGGYDSSALCSYMTEQGYDHSTFSLGFEGWEQSEHSLARNVSEYFGTTHFEHLMQKTDMVELVRQLSFHFDEPFGGSSLVPTYLVTELASKHVKVAIGGDGGDEVFAGYRWHKELFRNWHQSVPGKVKRAVIGDEKYLSKAYHKHLNWTSWRYADLKRVLNPEIFAAEFQKNDYWLYKQHLDLHHGPVKAMQLLDIHTFLPEVVLQKVDRAAMANSLELRVPFLDHELVESMMALDESTYFEPKTNKLILHELIKNKMPSSVLNAPKKGFGMPLTKLLDIDRLIDAIASSAALKDGILHPKLLEQQFLKQQLNKLWAVFTFAMWYERWGKS